MEQLQARIIIKHIKGADIAYLYNREDFDLLGIIRETLSHSQLIKIGDIISYYEVKYKVKTINFNMEYELNNMQHSKGTSLKSPSNPSNYNCQIVIIVEDTL